MANKKEIVPKEIVPSIEELMPKAVAYATNLIPVKNDPYSEWMSFKDFAVALTDYMGEDFIPYCRTVYRMLNVVMGGMAKLQSDQEVDAVSDEMIGEAFRKFREEQESDDRVKDFKENIDELQFLVKQYRKTEKFQKMLEFVSRCKFLSPYNAMLACLQKPDAQFVMTAKRWLEYGRVPKPEAQNIVILRPFGPVQCVYDISDTISLDGDVEPVMPMGYSEKQKAALMEEYTWQFVTERAMSEREKYNNLIDSLPNYGIAYNHHLQAAHTYAGKIQRFDLNELELYYSKEEPPIRHNSLFSLSVNSNYREEDEFRAICHELAHLLCGHGYLTYERDEKPIEEKEWNRINNKSKKECEFEAETVAWIVCKRAGVESRSAEYLAMYATDDEIPICSLEAVMKAAAEIEKMISTDGGVKLKDALWYKRDKYFKRWVDDEINRRKEPKLSR